MRLSIASFLALASVADGFSTSSVGSRVPWLTTSRSPSSQIASPSQRQHAVSSTTTGGQGQRRHSTDSVSLSMAVDRLSDECTTATKRGMDISYALQKKELSAEAMFCGVVAHPERAKRTLDKYGITSKDVDQVLLKGKPLPPPNTSTDPLPFGVKAKNALSRACQIADDLESPTVRSEHLLLALLGYNNGRPVVRVPAEAVLTKLPVVVEKGKFSVTDFCNDLVQSLPLISGTDADSERTVITRGDTGPVTGILAEIGVDWTQLALDGKLDPVFGRDDEIRSCLQTLGRRRKNNPVLIGDPGVGKSAVAEGVAQVLAQGLAALQQEAYPKPLSRLGKSLNFDMKPSTVEDTATTTEKANGGDAKETAMEDAAADGEDSAASVLPNLPPCPAALMGTRVISVELAALVSGTGSRGSLEERVKKLIKEATDQNVILFIDELHNLVATGGGAGGEAMNAANLLKPALARGELRVMGATTTPEYRQYIEADGALERRFQPLLVKEPTPFETLDILAAISPKYEAYHGVEYTYEALVAAAKLSDRYINDRYLPDKAVDLIDEAGSRLKMSEEEKKSFTVTENDIAAVVAELTGIPVGRLDMGEKQRLKNLESEMAKRIKGQPAAVRSVSKAIRRARSGMRDGKRPVSSFLFCGSTGVGKTELCKALASIYYGQEKDMIRIDMSEYMDRFSTSRLIGAPPGYVGYNEGGQLTEAVRRAPHSLILFDEVEKAHEDVLNILLQVMDDGQLTDGKGRTVSFRNNIFVMTTNLGSRELLQAAQGDDGNGTTSTQQLSVDVVTKALEDAMRPEFLNRIDEIVVFRPLDYENLKDIATNLVAATVERTATDLNIKLDVSENIAEIVTREALTVASSYGARPIRRAVQRYLDDTVSEAIMDDFLEDGDSATVNLAEPNGDTSVVKITRALDGETMLIDVDAETGIQEDAWSAAAYGSLPKLDGPPSKDPGAFQ